MGFERGRIKSLAASLAAKGVFIGTSSWKYSGWCGMLYDRSRDAFGGNFTESRFEKQCLSEYAEVFKSVCVDAWMPPITGFPTSDTWKVCPPRLPPDFLSAFKVTDEITNSKFANSPHFGLRAGQAE